ncbi:lipocalin family protein [Flavobacterium rivuli]|uniref:lipocalin family protein n=1 Tax=Flavobacterium rivuli TaxID=498301 RepID=UPI0012B52E79|nr:hypothetical protein [Flavobacterium rivuli]
MKKQLSLVFSLVAAFLILIGCNNDDDSPATANPIIGTWKLTEVYLNGQAVATNSCELEETYIFGADQFTHELYGNSGARIASNFRSSMGHDDSDEDSDENSDEDSDEHNDDSDEDTDETPTTPTDPTTPTTDNDTDEDSDEGSDDDNGGGSGTCVNTERILGYWTAQNNVYSLTTNDTTTQTTIVFENGNNRMYYEVTTTVNGQVRTRRYVFQRQ